jgi:WD40 repeat protein
VISTKYKNMFESFQFSLWALLSLGLLGVNLSCKSIPSGRASNGSFRLSMMAAPQAHPCLMSLVNPAGVNCLQWEANIDAAPTYEPSRRLIFSGGEDYLHVVDGDRGYPVADIKTHGRVITKVTFNQDRSLLYFGTDKGIIEALDAFSFKRHFLFTADSQINNNLTLTQDVLIFTSTMGSIYCLDQKTGLLKWEIKQPLSSERLRLASNSNVYVHEDSTTDNKRTVLFVPHADGYISVIDLQSGVKEAQISLGSASPHGFPDIVAPMVQLRNRLWVASHDFGLFGVDLSSRQIRDHIDLPEIMELTTDGQSLFAATPNALVAFSQIGRLIWRNDLKEIRSKTSPTTASFKDAPDDSKRIFFGLPSRLLTSDHYQIVIMASSAGSIGIFDKASGQLRKILGNSVGFGPKIDWAGPSNFVVVSKRGLLMKFEFAKGKSVDHQTATLFGPITRAWSGG